MPHIKLGDIPVEVVFKDIKNIHLSVHPPTGRVQISAPMRMCTDTIRVYGISKLDWIVRQQKKLREQARETRREFLERESHYVWGKRYLLKIVEKDRPPSVTLSPKRLVLSVRPKASDEKKAEVIAGWYRQQVRELAIELIESWEPILGVHVERLFVQRMKTKWGGCNTSARTIRLNSELGKKPKVCLEYIVVHEMVHLLERSHGERFVALMDKNLPLWKDLRRHLNDKPLGNESWKVCANL